MRVSNGILSFKTVRLAISIKVETLEVMKKIYMWCKKNIFLLTSLVIMGIIFWFSSQPADESARVSGAIQDYLSKFTFFATVFKTIKIRKIAHFCLYFLLGCSVFTHIRLNYYWKDISIYYIVSFIITLLYAISDEVHQLWVLGRSAELRDICIDCSGCLIALVINYIVIKKLIENDERKYNYADN